jgi:diguanylate cyclase (GGDEF)-like protein
VTPRRRFTILTLLLGGYVVILTALVGLGLFATGKMEQLRAITQDLYIHPFAVSNAATDLKGSLFQLRNHMLQIVLLRQQGDNIEAMAHEADGFARIAREDLAVIKANFLGDRSRVAELEIKLKQWDVIRAEILAAAESEDFVTAEHLVKTKGTPTFAEIVPLVDYVLTFARNRAKGFVDEAEMHTDQIIFRTRWLIALIGLFIVATGLAILWRVKFLQNELDRQATTDFLTNTPNRRHFMQLAQQEAGRSERYNAPLTLAVVDLDFFKAINDSYGHQVGDETLKKFCEVCRNTLRSSDVLGRIGGEEFAILLPNTTLSKALEVVERVRASVAESDIVPGLTPPLRLAASFGISAYSSAEKDLTSLFRRADEALYEAKASGRNRVCIRDIEHPQAGHPA